MFWHSLNTRDEGYRAKAVLDIADYLIENSVAESIYKSDADSEGASYIINNLRPYLRKIDLTSLKGEIADTIKTIVSMLAGVSEKELKEWVLTKLHKNWWKAVLKSMQQMMRFSLK